MMYIPLIPMVFQTYQRYNFESKSQPFESEAAEKGRCFRPIKDTILKANHNRFVFFFDLFSGVSDLSKIQF